MRTVASIVVALALCTGVAKAGEIVRVSGGQAVFTLNLPVVLPTLVVVQPGVSVVPGMDVEVFYSGGYYWTRRDDGWYRAQDHQGHWTRIDERQVPMLIARSPPGRYKHYVGHDNGKGSGKDKGKSDKGHGKPEKHGGAQE